MGYLKSLGTGFVWICTFLAIITFMPGLPPNIDFKPHNITLPTKISKPIPNENLSKAEKLFQGKLFGPESFDAYDGVLYFSAAGGGVYKLVGNDFVEVVRFGKTCHNMWEEDLCGRPLGLKFDKNGNLYVVDTYYGIFKVDVKTGNYEKIVDTSQPIEGKIPMIPNSIDIASNGDLYWTDSNTNFKLFEGLFSILSDPSGRLIHYNAKTKENKVLLENLGFANGIRLSEDENFVIVAETSLSRIIKYYLKGPKAGNGEIMVEGLPGLPDNIHSDNQGNFLVSLVVVADEDEPHLTQSLLPHPLIRKMIIRFLTLLKLPFKLLDTIYPNSYCSRAYYWIGSFRSAPSVFSERSIVLRIDNDGKILDVLISNSEEISNISSAFILNNYMWLGSPFNNFLARLSIDKIPEFKSKKIESKEKKNKQPEKPAPKPAKQDSKKPSKAKVEL
ncbi:adipocyte plasma membrane-associated protein Hemomucin-like [Microplitis mediator]|uniref:adipocyte plasma membrane-associated protein Hemomucin-like n=1 Tax=Microplitis mediator TaxID=375433 RepID=UPI002557378D|nr:adipocyte plasma membrane-associated protein Hemomucin-like [Microplitis mediator]XP_057320762.1 adipocyte plasma membrane-associated protein Hemomucin-like [Microplitis mediator]XP_057320770.1 adipocyte plasma membrane-associated protein Hemomucin-like [Microplitis mediator]